MMAAATRNGCCLFWSWALRALPWKLPCTLVGMAMSASACLMAAWASLSAMPSARLNDTVVASSPFWWLIEVGVAAWATLEMALSGVIGVWVVFSAEPGGASRRAGLAH